MQYPTSAAFLLVGPSIVISCRSLRSILLLRTQSRRAESPRWYSTIHLLHSEACPNNSFGMARLHSFSRSSLRIPVLPNYVTRHLSRILCISDSIHLYAPDFHIPSLWISRSDMLPGSTRFQSGVNVVQILPCVANSAGSCPDSPTNSRNARSDGP